MVKKNLVGRHTRVRTAQHSNLISLLFLP